MIKKIIMNIKFYEQTNVNLSKRKVLKKFIASIFLNEGKVLGGLTIIFCTDNYLLQINKDFLQHDYFTDIITFDLSESNTSSIIGEIYISVERVKENAATNQSSFHKELHTVIFHGALHLCGYTDKTESEYLTMAIKQDEYYKMYINF